MTSQLALVAVIHVSTNATLARAKEMSETCIRRKEKVVNLDHLIRSYVTLAIIADLLHDCVEGTAANV